MALSEHCETRCLEHLLPLSERSDLHLDWTVRQMKPMRGASANTFFSTGVLDDVILSRPLSQITTYPVIATVIGPKNQLWPADIFLTEHRLII